MPSSSERARFDSRAWFVPVGPGHEPGLVGKGRSGIIAACSCIGHDCLLRLTDGVEASRRLSGQVLN